MELFKRTNIDFVRLRVFAYFFSGILVAGSLASLAYQGLNFGIDFAGGTLVQLRFVEPPEPHGIRATLATMKLGDVVIQEFGDPRELLVRVEEQKGAAAATAPELAKRIVTTLQPTVKGEIELRRVEFVGPQVGEELTTQGFLAVLYSMVAILAYVAFRFEFRFALGAVVALAHDVIITLGVFSVFHREFTLVVVAAVLTVIGYSINDTIVVFDRIREEMKLLRKQPLSKIINVAINETISRTVITSLTVVLVLIALLLLGGEVIHDFALALLVGVGIGTYSSIYVASPIVLLMARDTEGATAPEEGTP